MLPIPFLASIPSPLANMGERDECSKGKELQEKTKMKSRAEISMEKKALKIGGKKYYLATLKDNEMGTERQRWGDTRTQGRASKLCLFDRRWVFLLYSGNFSI